MNIDEVISKMKLKEDREFIREQLNRHPTNARHCIFGNYLEQWRIGRDAEPIPYKKQNAGRYQANSWIINL